MSDYTKNQTPDIDLAYTRIEHDHFDDLVVNDVYPSKLFPDTKFVTVTQYVGGVLQSITVELDSLPAFIKTLQARLDSTRTDAELFFERREDTI